MDAPAAAPALRDIHLPPAPGVWPPAPGWWVLAAILLAIAILALWKWRQVRLRERRRGAVLSELRQLRSAWLQHADAQRLATNLSHFLRRLSRVSDPHSVALNGKAWLDYLDRFGDGFSEHGQALVDAPYRPAVSVDADALYELTERHTRQVLEREWRHV